MRDIEHLSPTRLRRSDGIHELKSAIRNRGEVLSPHDAEEPILAPPVRAALFGWLTEINAAEELKAVGLKPRSTGLLFGPPGCGKTTLAHHLAARLGLPMVLVGSENLYAARLGEAEKNVASLFDAISDCDTRCVVLLDEIDAIGGKRAEERGGGATTARNSMLTVLLRKIEAFDGILIAATNREDSLDPALWRRFGMQISVDLPDADSRYAILKRYGLPFAFEEDTLDFLAGQTEGAAPSLLRQMMEGMKRNLVLGTRLRLPVDDKAAMFRTIISQVAPHPDYEPPALWRNQSLLDLVPAETWPPPKPS